jgi:hypothetical protein
MNEHNMQDEPVDQPKAAALPGGATGETAKTASPASVEPPSAEMPPVPDDIREAARLAPDHWLGMVDPAWSGEGPPPEWAMVGQWRSDESGQVVEWQKNEDYRPSPAMLGWPEPVDPVDAAVQLAATGYGPGEEVTRALADAELAVLVRADGQPVTAATTEGTAVVPAFTSPPYLELAGPLAYEVMPVTVLVDRIPEEHLLYLNPTGPIPVVMEAESLRAAIAEREAEGRTSTASEPAVAVPAVGQSAERQESDQDGRWEKDGAHGIG